jgi:hypothetical protein
MGKGKQMTAGEHAREPRRRVERWRGERRQMVRRLAGLRKFAAIKGWDFGAMVRESELHSKHE